LTSYYLKLGDAQKKERPKIRGVQIYSKLFF